MNKTILYMETTRIEPNKTVTEIQMLLGRYGCKGIMMTYEKREIVAVFFQMNLFGKDIPFRLPCRWQTVHQNFILRREKGERLHHKVEDDTIQAKRVAWRQILRWLQAQLALVETDMVKIQEVFMPYIQVNLEGQTLFEKLEQTKFKMLEHKE